MINEPAREIKSVKTAFEVIQVLQDMGGAKPARLIDELELSKSSVHNYLRTLEGMGYVVSENGTYRVGLRFLTHGIAARQSIRGRRIVLSELSTVAEELAVLMWWVVEEHGRGMFIDVAGVNSERPLYGRIGKRSYLHTHAVGKAILSLAPEPYVTQVIDYHGLPALTDETTVDRDVLFTELADIQENGFAVSEDGAALGIRSIGAAFRDGGGGLNALGLFAESRELTESATRKYGEVIRESASSIESQLAEDGD